MENAIIKKILAKSDNKDLLNILTKTLSFTELNSLMLEVYRLRSSEMTPKDLMKSYELNRYVKPSEQDPIKLRELELDILKTAEGFSFIPIELSPVAPLGTCSVVGTVNQNKVLSAQRGTEVIADATNSLALHICSQKRNKNKRETQSRDYRLKYCTIQRHIRTQIYDNPRFTPHFKPFCMVTSGRDTGSFSFERENILEHLNFYKSVLRDIVNVKTFKLKLFKTGQNENSERLFMNLAEYISINIDTDVEILEDTTRLENQYYRGFQYKIYINLDSIDIEVGDGGFVDWSQRILENKKERMLISAIGLDPLLGLY